jgi:hypothetical protein
VNWVKGLLMKMPALLINVSIRPNRANPWEIARSAVFRSAISPQTTRTSSSAGISDRAIATTRSPRAR